MKWGFNLNQEKKCQLPHKYFFSRSIWVHIILAVVYFGVFVFDSEVTLQEHLPAQSTGFSFACFEKSGLDVRFNGI